VSGPGGPSGRERPGATGAPEPPSPSGPGPETASGPGPATASGPGPATASGPGPATASGPASVYRVGLTGGLASGKSTVAGWLREAGCEVIDADVLVAELYRPGGAGAAAARRLFGDAVLTPQGGADHAVLAARVFADPAARRALEREIHPLVRRRFEEIAAATASAGSPPTATAAAPEGPATPGAPAAPPMPEAAGPGDTAAARGPWSILVLEATLLVEAGYGPAFDLIVTLEADPEARLRRAVARGLDESAARARLAAQGDGVRRRQGAHRVIRNDGDLAALRRQVDALIADLRAAAAAKAATTAEAAGAGRR
jgi:dephospho-CoA kinase